MSSNLNISAGSTTTSLEDELFRRCSRKLHFVGRAYLSQSRHLIHSCRILVCQSSILRFQTKAHTQLQDVISEISHALDSTAHIVNGHRRSENGDRAFQRARDRLTRSVQALLMMSGPFKHLLQQTYNLDILQDKLKEDARKGRSIEILQKRIIDWRARGRRKYPQGSRCR